MVIEIIRDAIHLKLKSKVESPIISVYEFCYAAGLGLRVMKVSEDDAASIQNMESFEELKVKVQEMSKDAQEFDSYPQGKRLQSLIVGCRIGGEMSKEARALFAMGFSGT